MKLRILGPLEVDDAEGNPIRLPTGRQRALLVVLLLRRGEVVSMDALIEALWGERAPSTAGKAVQGYVSHLRRLLGGEAAAALVTRSPGYVLQVEDDQVDAMRFERLAAEGQRALEDGDAAGALTKLDAALALWRGPALAEFAFDDFAQREIQRLTERRLEVLEDRVDALLQLGRHSGLVSELETLVAANPLRERPRGQLMLALYRSGRPADALHAYKEGARLSRELGLDPAPELRSLERAILDQDPELAAPARVTPGQQRVRELPAGTVTLLSSDIEGSTALVRSVGPETWSGILARHQSLMRDAFAAHGGTEVDTQGDAFFAAFPRAGDALAAAIGAQRSHLDAAWPDDARVSVRIGIHTGAPMAGDERYLGLDVHRVARVTAAAHGGEILCTASTAALVDTDEAGLHLVDLGAYLLKDFSRPERLLRVVAHGLPDSFPPPVAVPDSLPARRRRTQIAASAFAAALVLATVAALVIDRVQTSPSAVTPVPPAVAVVDPETNRVVASIKTGSKPVAITAGDGAVWVGDTRDGTVTRIDPVTRSVVKTIGIGAPAVDIAASGGSVWVATGGFGTVVQIDSELDAEVDTIDLGVPNDPIVPSASAVAAGREGVWVGAFDGLVRIDPRSGEISARVDLGRTPALQIAVGGGAVWSTIVSSRAKRVEASSAQETAEFYAGDFVFPLALDGSALWVGGGRGQLWKVDPVTGATILATNVGFPVEGIALGEDTVWVAVANTDTLLRIDPATGETVARIPIGGSPREVAVEQGLVWVAVQEAEPES